MKYLASAATVLYLVTSSVTVTASAAESTARQAMGTDARQWVDLQISGEAAERSPDGMPGEIAERVWQRYVESFSHPIPEKFEREGFVEGSN